MSGTHNKVESSDKIDTHPPQLEINPDFRVTANGTHNKEDSSLKIDTHAPQLL